MFKKIVALASRRKLATGVVVCVVLGGSYFLYSLVGTANAETKYVLATVQKGTIVSSISGSGQVSASNQVDIKPKVSGDVTYVGVKGNQEVKTGTVLAYINARDAQKAVRDAQINLESAQLSLEKTMNPADPLSLLQMENSLAQAKESKQQSEDDLKKAYEDEFNSVSDTFLNLPNIIDDLNDVLLGYSFGVGQSNMDFYVDAIKAFDSQILTYKADAYTSYQTARAAYDKNFNDYKATSRFSDLAAIEALTAQTYETTKLISESLKSATNLVQFYQNELIRRQLKPHPLSDTQLSSLGSGTSKVNSLVSSLLAQTRSLNTTKQSIVTADRTIAERTVSLAKLQSGADPLDLRSQQIAVQQRQDALADARGKLADYSVRAPFAGVLGSVSVHVGDSVSTGTVVTTLLTKQRIAKVSFNEVDIAKIKVGQKTTLTFDAIENLTISGTVLEVDASGTVSQGVVNYGVVIGFDTQDDRIKPGMSVSAAVITDTKQDVLMVPNGAIKSLGATSYVEVPSDATEANTLMANASGNSGVVLGVGPRQQAVEVGLANDTSTEVTNGLKEGDVIVVRTVLPSTAKTQTTQSNSLFPSTGTRRAGSTGGFQGTQGR